MADRQLRLVLVTPEKTLLDLTVRSVQLPLFDGLAGILPGRAPMVGRLGYGQLKFAAMSGEGTSYFIEGGFVQVKGSVVSVLTHAAGRTQDIQTEAAQQALVAAKGFEAHTEEEFATKQQQLDRARRMLSASKS